MAAAAFPAEGSHLQRYASVFSAVEINSSFYRAHLPATYSRWRDSVPDIFRFSVKMPREITHVRRLRDTADLLDRFLFEVHHLEEKLGCLLIQLPPSLAFNPQEASDFLASLRSRFDGHVVFEARHVTWTLPEAVNLLADSSIACVFADPAPIPPLSILGAGIAYLRLHGSPEMYRSSYSDSCLAKISQLLDEQQSTSRDVWCIFDNTMDGAAIRNALTLRELSRA